MIDIKLLYLIVGIMFVLFGIASLINKNKTIVNKISGGFFWISYGVIFLFGDFIPPFVIGLLIILLALIALFNLMKPAKITDQEIREKIEIDGASRFKNKLFIPALLVPILTLIGTFLAPHLPFIGPSQHTLIALAFAIIVAFITALFMFKASAIESLKDGAHTMDEIGWAGLLPQILATLGIIFLNVGVGDQVSKFLSMYFNFHSLFFSVALYSFSMAIFTIIMGNAFAAFPILTAAIALPVLINGMGGDPVVIGAIGMLSGFCGTLMTPMAANFNIVPVALLNIKDRNAVIKAQFLSGLLILIANTFLIYFFAF